VLIVGLRRLEGDGAGISHSKLDRDRWRQFDDIRDLFFDQYTPIVFFGDGGGNGSSDEAATIRFETRQNG